MVITADQEKFIQNGYHVFDPEIAEHVLDAAAAATKDAIEGPHYGGRAQDLHWQHDSVKRLALYPSVIKTVADLYGVTPRPFQTLNFDVGTAQPTHSDTVHFNSIPAGWMCGVWIALEDIGPEQGPLVYYPGSHNLLEYTLKDLNVGERKPSPGGTMPGYERLITSVIAKRNLKPAYFTCPKGHALIWAANLLHGGSKINDPETTRYSQVTHYFFPRCTYYTPRNSTPGNLHFREPNWIVW